jgi:hypothetical protein
MDISEDCNRLVLEKAKDDMVRIVCEAFYYLTPFQRKANPHIFTTSINRYLH